MSERTFKVAFVARADHGNRQSAAEIVCGACGEKDHVINANNSSRLPPGVVTKKFTQAGWIVGAGASADRCPACAAKLKAPKPALKIVPKEPDMAVPAPAVAPSNDQKRKINAKLFEVYEGPEHGYAAGWGDQRVADELKVPRAAVAEIREQFFGPAKDSPDVRAFLERSEVIFAEAASIERRVSDLVREAAALKDSVTALRKEHDAIKKAVGA